MMKRLFLALLPLLAGFAPPAPSSDIAGGYFTSQPEVASELMLKPDGRFQWYLTYGALDESAEGRWQRDGDRVLLTTEPIVKPPRFTLDSAIATPEEGLKVRVAGPDGRPIGRVDVALIDAGGSAATAVTDDGGYAMFERVKGKPTAVKLGISVFGIVSDAFPVDPAKGNLMLFRFEPNDLGKADFRATALRIEGGMLVLDRWGVALKYHPADAE